MSYSESSFTSLGQLKLLAQRTTTKLNTTIKFVNVTGNKINFYVSTDGTGSPLCSVDFPKELYLDQVQTQFISSFEFSAATYPDTTNPNLDGKPVLVIAVKDNNQGGTAVYTYSFIDMTSLVDVYTIASGDSAKILSILNNAITFHISAEPNNAITVKNDGLHVDISGKTDKVANATAGHIVTLDANGNILDSGVAIATNAEVTEMLNEVFGA